MGLSVTEVFGLFGFKVAPGTETKLRDFTNLLGDLHMSTVLSALGLGAAGAALGDFAERTGELSQSLINLHEVTGIPIKDLQQWEEYAQLLGVSKKNADGLLLSFQGALGELERSGQLSNLLSQLNIKADKDPRKFFLNVVQGLNAIKDVAYRLSVAKSFGLTPDDLAIGLRMIKDPNFQKNLESRPYMTDEQIGIWKEMQQTWTILVQDTENLIQKMTPIAEVLEYLAKILNPTKVPENALAGRFGFAGSAVANAARLAGAVSENKIFHNHMTIHVTGPLGEAVAQIESAITEVIKSAFYKQPKQQR